VLRRARRRRRPRDVRAAIGSAWDVFQDARRWFWNDKCAIGLAASGGIGHLQMCDVPAAGASPATRCASDVTYELFQEVDSQDKDFVKSGVWFKAFIIKSSGSGKRLMYKVHFSGWGKDNDEHVSPDKLRMRTDGAEVGPRGDESVAEVTRMYAHVNLFIQPVSKEFRRLPNPERPAVVRCNTASQDQELRRLEELAVPVLKQELDAMAVRLGNRSMLHVVRKVMKQWNARSVRAIVKLALDELAPALAGGGGGVGGGVSEGVCDLGAPEIICISSDDDSFDRDSPLAASEPKSFFEAAKALEPPNIPTTPIKARSANEGTAEAVIIADPDCDSVGRDDEPAPASSSSSSHAHLPLSSPRAASTSRPHRINITNCPVEGCTGSWTSELDKKKHENSVRHVAALLKQSVSAPPPVLKQSVSAPPGVAPSAAPPLSVLILDSVSSVADATPSTPSLPAAPAASATAACAATVSSAPPQPAPKRGRPKMQQQYLAKSSVFDTAPAAATAPVCCSSGDCASASSGSILRDAGFPDGHDDVCMVCHFGGELLMCDYQGCKNTSHLQCAGLNENPQDDEEWYCVQHSKSASTCSSEKRRCERSAPSLSHCSYCSSASASCQCRCLECDSSRGTRIRCPKCNRCFHQ
jgi:hypothetical protein